MKVSNFTELYLHATEGNEILGRFLTGHLAIEFLLRRLIEAYDSSLSPLSEELNHFRLIKLNYEIESITEKQKDVLIEINRIRNTFAHNISHQPTIKQLRQLFVLAEEAFSDLTDGINQGKCELYGLESIEELEGWVISELFVQICYDLHEVYQSRGGDIEDF